MSPERRSGEQISPADAWALIASPDRKVMASRVGSLAIAERLWRRHRATILADDRSRRQPPTAWWLFDSGAPDLADRPDLDPRVPKNRELMRAFERARAAVLKAHPDRWRFR